MLHNEIQLEELANSKGLTLQQGMVLDGPRYTLFFIQPDGSWNPFRRNQAFSSNDFDEVVRFLGEQPDAPELHKVFRKPVSVVIDEIPLGPSMPCVLSTCNLERISDWKLDAILGSVAADDKPSNIPQTPAEIGAHLDAVLRGECRDSDA